MLNNSIRYFLLFVIIIFSSCGDSESTHKSSADIRKPLSWGKSDVIFIFADKMIWDYGKLEIEKSLEREFFTTRNEKLFTLRKEEAKDIKKYYKFANLLFFCNLNSDNPTSKYVKSVLPNQSHALSDSIPAKIYISKNLWAQNQIVTFVIGKDAESLLLHTFEQSDVIFDVFKNRERERLKNLIYKPGLNKKETEYYEQNYPWQIDLPKQYITFKRDDENHFVAYLLRVKKYPDRFLAIYWEEMAKNEINKDWLWNKRLELGKKYYDADEFSKCDVTQKKVKFLTYDTFKLSGRWQNPDNFVGGAFTSFAFYDENQKIAYLIDNSVFFPEGNKLRALLALEIISETFKTNYRENEE